LKKGNLIFHKTLSLSKIHSLKLSLQLLEKLLQLLEIVPIVKGIQVTLNFECKLIGENLDCGSQSRIKGGVKRGANLLLNQCVIELHSRFKE
jgi:hypothetical protein